MSWLSSIFGGSKGAKEVVTNLLKNAGITVNGKNSWDIKVHDERFYSRVLSGGSLALGESYMDKWWDAHSLDQFFHKLLLAELDNNISYDPRTIILFLQSRLFNRQNKSNAKENVRRHYDISRELYMSFLDPYNQYTCGYFKDTKELNTAQEKKLNLICQKLQLKSSDKVLDIGCGWGGFAKFAAKKYGCHVTGVTISDDQEEYAKNFTKNLPVEIIKSDYRDLKSKIGNKKFDKILICGMIEHVGYKNYSAIMEVVNSRLEDDGLFLLHTIGGNVSKKGTDPWIDRYIFPGSMLPSANQLASAAEGNFVMEDWHNFGQYYDQTLMAWFKNFDKSWSKISKEFDERFYRMWKYYLLSCAGLFRARKAQLWQIVYSKRGLPGGYKSVR